MRTAERVRNLPPYLFVEISRKIAEQREKGVRVISFGIGDPDLPTHPHILEALHEHTDVPANHRYPETEGLPELRECIARWMAQRFEVSLDPATEIVPLIGAKEGIANSALCFIDPGDVALVPDPAYPVYAIGTMFAGGTSHAMPLTEENGFLPDLDAIPADVRERARVLWINYPIIPPARWPTSTSSSGRRNSVSIAKSLSCTTTPTATSHSMATKRPRTCRRRRAKPPGWSTSPSRRRST